MRVKTAVFSARPYDRRFLDEAARAAQSPCEFEYFDVAPIRIRPRDSTRSAGWWYWTLAIDVCEQEGPLFFQDRLA